MASCHKNETTLNKEDNLGPKVNDLQRIAEERAKKISDLEKELSIAKSI